ncbi:efflux RND transporter periplasmic adaptor subunit [Pseudoduganella danionis]|uniref:efflux RND transporter periplasmic adaptor subunit n=1 Tax=Pseudoduganella danionis TaxID=1890295 RepID=UPI0035B3EE19
MDHHTRSINLPLAGVLVAVAAALGFGAAHWLDGRKAPAAAPVAAAAPAPEGSSEIKIPAEYIKLAQIAVEAVGNGGVGGEILSSGSVSATPNNEAVILARTAGNIARLHRQLGDTVRAGEVLAQVDSMEAAGLAADASAAAAKLTLARASYAREATLFEQGVSPRQDMEAAKAALQVAESEAQRAAAVAKAAQVAKDGKSVTVISPIDGKITVQTGTLGGYVQPQTELFRVTGNGPKQIEAPVLATDIGRIRAGDKATVVAASGAPITATVRSVTSALDSATRTATAILTADAGGDTLIAGEGVQVRLHARGAAAGLVVPEDAVQNIDGRDVLFVRTKDGFKPQPVLVGERSGGTAQIVSGVRAGELVATRNAFLVKADMIKSAKEE